jgi:hypothetical protein
MSDATEWSQRNFHVLIGFGGLWRIYFKGGIGSEERGEKEGLIKVGKNSKNSIVQDIIVGGSGGCGARVLGFVTSHKPYIVISTSHSSHGHRMLHETSPSIKHMRY